MLRLALGLPLGAALLALPACASGDEVSADSPGPATDGVCTSDKACSCPDGASGVEKCLEDGSGFGECTCEAAAPSEATRPCGDKTCATGETCENCPEDCGACEPCTQAPKCASATTPPSALEAAADLDVALDEMPPEQILARLEQLVAEAGPGARTLAGALSPFDQTESAFVTHLRGLLTEHPAATNALRRQLGRAGMSEPSAYRAKFPEPVTHEPRGGEAPAGGTLACGAPLLRIRVAQINVHEEDDDFANDIVYCSIFTEGKDGGEIRVTPQTPNLDEGDSHDFSVAEGIMWGQLQPRTPGANLTVTYDCFEVDSSDGYANLLQSIGSAAGKMGGIAQGYGWIFKTAGVVLSIVGTALSLDADDHLLNATQLVPLEKHLELTNGRFWRVRKEGTHYGSDWDWELRIEAWGCAEKTM